MLSDVGWIIGEVEKLTDEKINIQVSEWAEKRYLPPELTSKPGYWDNNYVPFLREIMDCLSVDSPVRKLAWMKAAQIAATTGVIENFIGYTIDHAPSSMMYISADKELVKMSVEAKLDRMLQSCGLTDKIRSPEENSRKTGNTSTKKEFPGGFLIAVGARNPGKLRSMSIKNGLLDEVDGMPEKLGSEGDPVKLIEARTKAFERTRKLVYLSTPLVKQTSRIAKLYEKGDQRKFYVPCKDCGHMQHLVWQGQHSDGRPYGIVYKTTDKGVLIEESVGYVCRQCGIMWHDYDKTWFLHRGEWRPTSEPKEKNFRSYHLNSLYSPAGMYSWTGAVYDWFDAYDPLTKRVKDIEALKTFVNTVKGEPWEERGEAPKYERVIAHRRASYDRNEIPNRLIRVESGAPLQIVTMACDVHKERIDCEIIGWAKDGRSYSLDWRHLEGDTDNTTGRNSPWHKVRDIIEHEVWTADTGEQYRVQVTMIDAGYRTDTVYQFAAEYSAGVFPVMGRDAPVRNAKMREFNEYTSKAGTRAFNINVTLYKDRMAAWLKRDWNEGELQPLGYPNYPQDYGDDYFREYEAEYKAEKKNKKTGMRLGFYWVKMPNKPNHAWDCRIYNMAALDIIAHSVCENDLGQEGINYKAFWEFVIKNKLYFS